MAISFSSILRKKMMEVADAIVLDAEDTGPNDVWKRNNRPTNATGIIAREERQRPFRVAIVDHNSVSRFKHTDDMNKIDSMNATMETRVGNLVTICENLVASLKEVQEQNKDMRFQLDEFLEDHD